MGTAAYNRGSKAIRDQINRKPSEQKSLTEIAYSAGLEQGRKEAEAEISKLRKKARRGVVAFARMQGYLTVERRRYATCIDRLRSFRDSFRGKGADRAAWAAIIALGRAEKE